jgi:hypothetical protein
MQTKIEKKRLKLKSIRNTFVSLITSLDRFSLFKILDYSPFPFCRGVVTTDAIGWLELGPNGRWRNWRRGSVVKTTHGRTPKLTQTPKHTQTPRFTQVQGPHEDVRPLLMPLCTMMDEI